MENFYDCKNDTEKQDLRDRMLEHMYYQVLAMRSEVAYLKELKDKGVDRSGEAKI